MLTKSACANLAAKFSGGDLLNFWVVMYISWSLSLVTLFSISVIFVL